MKSTINDRVRLIAEKVTGGNISELARLTGLRQSTLRDIVGTKQVKPGFDTLSSLVDNSTLNIDGNWLLAGEGEMFRDQEHVGSNKKLLSFAEQYFNYLTRSDNSYTTTEIAKSLDMSARELNEKLKKMGIICEESGKWMLCDKYIGNGYQRSRMQIAEGGIDDSSEYMVWTAKGRLFLSSLFPEIINNTQEKRYSIFEKLEQLAKNNGVLEERNRALEKAYTNAMERLKQHDNEKNTPASPDLDVPDAI